jgi:hypothetical protein
MRRQVSRIGAIAFDVTPELGQLAWPGVIPNCKQVVADKHFWNN